MKHINSKMKSVPASIIYSLYEHKFRDLGCVRRTCDYQENAIRGLLKCMEHRSRVWPLVSRRLWGYAASLMGYPMPEYGVSHSGTWTPLGCASGLISGWKGSVAYAWHVSPIMYIRFPASSSLLESRLSALADVSLSFFILSNLFTTPPLSYNDTMELWRTI